jgi:hypothetical protein
MPSSFRCPAPHFAFGEGGEEQEQRQNHAAASFAQISDRSGVGDSLLSGEKAHGLERDFPLFVIKFSASIYQRREKSCYKIATINRH